MMIRLFDNELIYIMIIFRGTIRLVRLGRADLTGLVCTNGGLYVISQKKNN